MGRVGEYEVLETLGQGAYSKVKRVLHIPTGELFVAKIIHKMSERVEAGVRLEISILRRLKHRNIVQLIEILESSNNFYIILEPVMGGDLCDLMMSSPEPLPEQDVAALFIQLLAGVRACHRNGIAHRDLKPENLLLTTNGILKISDFGLSRLHRESNFKACANEYAHTLTGTLAYVAPEVFDRTYDAFRADIWSMGCIAYVLLTQNFPFGSASDPHELEKRIRNGDVSTVPSTVSAEARHLCLWLLSPRPEDRPTLDEVAQHPFFTKNLPCDYLSLADSRRSLVVQYANVNEFSSEVQDDPAGHGESKRERAKLTVVPEAVCAGAASAVEPTGAGHPAQQTITQAADPTAEVAVDGVSSRGSNSSVRSKRSSDRGGKQPSSHEGNYSAVSQWCDDVCWHETHTTLDASVEITNSRRSRPFVK